jgi:hypothetical protein
MRIAKWISPVMVALGLAIGAQAAKASLFESTPGACKPVKAVNACEPVKKVDPLPPACKPVQRYVPHVKPCDPVQAVKACEPVKGCDGSHEFVLDRLANKVDHVLHVTAYKLHAWKHDSYAKEYSAGPCDPVAPVSAPPASAPAPLPAAPAPAAWSHS